MPSLNLTLQELISTIGAYLALLFRATARVLFEHEPVESEGEPEALDLGILRLDQAIHQAEFELARSRAEAETEATLARSRAALVRSRAEAEAER